MNLLPSLGLAVLSGVLYFTGFVGFDQWYLTFVCLAPVLVALHGTTSWKRALLVSWVMGFVTHLGGYFWVVHLLQTFAHLPLPLAFLGYVLLCAAQGASLAVFGLLSWLVAKRSTLPVVVVAAPVLLAVEWLYPLLFPSYLGNAFAYVPSLTQTAELGGPLLVTLVPTLTSAAVAELVLSRRERRRPGVALLGAAAALTIFTLGWGALRVPMFDARDAAAPKLRTAIVQANVGAGDKHKHAQEGIRRYREMTDAAMAQEGIGLVVWPESGLNKTVGAKRSNLTGEVAAEVKVPMIVGGLFTDRFNQRRRIWNTAFALAPGGEIVARYDKTILLAFGEYVPGDQLFPGIYDLLPYTGRFERGVSVQPLPVGPYRLSTDICYEDILPSFIRTLMIPLDAAGTRPHAMVNITNDSWYGPHEPPIHLALAIFRSIEHRRWLVRSTATGISAFVDSSGRIVQKSAFEQAETLVADVPMVTDGPTIYGLLGDWPGWLGLLAVLLGLAAPRLRRAKAPTAPAS